MFSFRKKIIVNQAPLLFSTLNAQVQFQLQDLLYFSGLCSRHECRGNCERCTSKERAAAALHPYKTTSALDGVKFVKRPRALEKSSRSGMTNSSADCPCTEGNQNSTISVEHLDPFKKLSEGLGPASAAGGRRDPVVGAAATADAACLDRRAAAGCGPLECT